MSSKSEIEDFIGHFPRIAGELCGESEYDEEPELRESLSKLLNCTVPTGKKNRGLAVVSSYKILQDADGITSETEKLANVLGWCVEMVSARKKDHKWLAIIFIILHAQQKQKKKKQITYNDANNYT